MVAMIKQICCSVPLMHRLSLLCSKVNSVACYPLKDVNLLPREALA